MNNTVASCSFLGIQVHRLTHQDLNQKVAEIVTSGQRAIVANHNLHSLYLFHKDAELREFFERSDYIHADGMGLVILSRLCRSHLRPEHRTTYVDWLPSLMQLASAKKWRVFYIGSKPGVAEKGAQALRARHSTLMIETQDGYFDTSPGSTKNAAIVARINQFQPHLLIVGMGMPRQERWIYHNLSSLQCNVILPAGAAIDYIAGVVPTPPRWASRLALEWAFRLLAEPRRLSHRYLIEPWYLAGLVFRQWLGLRHWNS